jgi:hypothetical protein
MVIAPPSRHGEKNTDDCWITWDVFTNPIIDDEGESSPKLFQWEFQDPKMEVPTIYKAYVREYPHKIWLYMVQYLHFWILEFPLII